MIIKTQHLDVPHHISLISGIFFCFRLLTGPVNAVFLLSRGITLFDLTVMQIIFYTFSLVANYPIGYLTDKFKHKKLLSYSFWLTALSFGLFLYAPHLGILYLAQIIMSIGITLADINFSTWLAKEIDVNLQDHKHSLDYYSLFDEEIRSIGGIISSAIFCILTVAVEKCFFYEGLYIATVVLIIALQFYLYIIPEHPNFKGYAKQRDQSLHQSIWSIIKPYNQILFLAISSIIWCAYQPLFSYWQPLLVDHGYKFKINVPNNIELVLGVSFLTQNLTCLIFNEIVKRMADFKINFYILGSILAFIGGICYFIIGHHTTKKALCLASCSILQGCMSVLWRITRTQCLKNNDNFVLGRLLSFSNILSSYHKHYFAWHYIHKS